MNKRYLPVIAALLIAVTCTAFLPVFAQLPTYIYAAPTLSVVTIAQDDQMRGTGVIWIAPTLVQYGLYWKSIGSATPILPVAQDLMAQYKVLVSYNGVPVTPSTIFCQIIEKDKSNPIKDQQFPAENLETVPVDMTGSFMCKFRWSAAPGVGVLDLYYTGPGLPVNIADYVVYVGASYAVGRSIVWGSDIQDVCVLAYPNSPLFTVITKPDGTLHYVYVDPLAPYRSCEDLAMFEKAALGVPIPWT